jgi:tetratricopeptide (TPR) repeat protein
VPDRAWRRFGPAALTLIVASALLAAGVGAVLCVPEGSIAVRHSRVLAAGRHLRFPFARHRMVPVAGRLAGLDIPRRTSEGADLVVRIGGAYRIDPSTVAGRAGDLETLGIDGLAGRAARQALDAIPTAVLVPADPLAARGWAPLPPPAIEAVGRSLRAAGIEISGLHGRIGAATAFAAAGPETGSGGEGHAEGATPMPRAADTGLRVVMIGLDGADWDLVDPLLRAGRLPHLERLVTGGARGPLRSYDPMISPLLWTTMVTGVGPDIHGVADFQAVDTASGRRVPITSRFRKVKAIWNILGEAGRTSGFVGWWASYPAEAVEGFQVSNLVAFETLRPRAAVPPAPGLTFPPDYFDTVLPRLATVADLRHEDLRGLLQIERAEFEAARDEVLHPSGPQAEGRDRKLVQQPVALALSILTGSRNYATIAADLAGRRLDLTAVYFEGIDMMGHRFQHCLPPRAPLCPAEDYHRYRDAVTGFYVRQDALIGTVLAAAGGDATVLVVSDHGFKSGAGRPAAVLPYTTQQPVEWHDEDGLLILSGPGARRGARLFQRATLFDIAPTLLYLLGLPAAEDMPGRILFEAIDPAFAAAHPVRSLASYETVGRPRSAVVTTQTGGSEAAEAELLANLRALGYIGGEDDGTPGAVAGEGPRAGVAGIGAGGAGPGADTQVFYHRNLATYYLKQQDFVRAAEQLRLANARQRLGKNYQLLAEALLGMGRRDEALSTLEEGLETLDSMDPESVLYMVRIALGDADRDPAAAAGIARRWAARTAARPGLDDAIQGLLLEPAGRTAEAAAAFRRSLAADPTRVAAAQRLHAILPPGERAAAIEPILRRALAQDARIDEYHNLLGIILAERGRPAEALEAFRQAEALDPLNARFAANLAGALAKMEHWDEAAAAYERAAALAPAAPTYMKLGSAYRRLKDAPRALAAFEKARELDRDGSGPLLGIALAHAEMNRVDRAIAVVREGLERVPGDPALQSLYRDLISRRRNPG